MIREYRCDHGHKTERLYPGFKRGALKLLCAVCGETARKIFPTSFQATNTPFKAYYNPSAGRKFHSTKEMDEYSKAKNVEWISAKECRNMIGCNTELYPQNWKKTQAKRLAEQERVAEELYRQIEMQTGKK